MNDKNYIIAIDSGTQSVRAILFDHEGKEVASEQAPHEPYFSLNPGWAEQMPQDYWLKLCQCTRGLMAKIKIDPRKISGIGITSQRATVIPVDKDGNALRPAIIWLDLRTNADMSKLDKTIGFAADLIGGQRQRQMQQRRGGERGPEVLEFIHRAGSLCRPCPTVARSAADRPASRLR